MGPNKRITMGTWALCSDDVSEYEVTGSRDSSTLFCIFAGL